MVEKVEGPIKELLYISPEYGSLEEVRKQVMYYDNSTLKGMATCPRQFYYNSVRHLRTPGRSRPLYAGSALHAAIDGWDYGLTVDEALDVLEEEWDDTDSHPCDDKFKHLTLSHLKEVFSNYVAYAKDEGSIFTPVRVKWEDLDLSQVVAAKFRILPGGEVLLGESNIVMKFPVSKGTLYYAGKPDSVKEMPNGRLYIMDHKSTTSYLSEWWAKQWIASNQMRPYIGMVQNLLNRKLHGFIINGIHVGPGATNPNSRATRFCPYRFDVSQDAVQESLENQFYWTEIVESHLWFKDPATYQQHGQKGCQGCWFKDICATEPELREGVIATDYVVDETDFFDI